MAQRLTDYPRPAGPAVSHGGIAGDAASDPLALKTLRAWLTWPAWLSLAAVLVFSLIFPALAVRWQFWPFVIGLIFLGLPHGALDHLAPLFILHKRLTLRYLTLFVLGYAALVLVYLAFWHVFPLAALAIFLLCSWLHWGQGDTYFLRVFDGQPAPPSRWGSFLIWTVRGGLPIILPPLAHPAAFASVTGGILNWYGSRTDWRLTGLEREIGIAVFALAVAAYLWQSWRLSRSTFWRDAGEVALLLAYFLVVPAILAVGVYFCVWHSARHIGRLMHLNPADQRALALGKMGRCIGRSAAQALPMTLGALAFLAGLYWWQGQAHAPSHVTIGSVVYLYLSLIAALTFPHFLLVLWMDWEEFGQNRRHSVVIGGRGETTGNGL